MYIKYNKIKEETQKGPITSRNQPKNANRNIISIEDSNKYVNSLLATIIAANDASLMLLINNIIPSKNKFYIAHDKVTQVVGHLIRESVNENYKTIIQWS